MIKLPLPLEVFAQETLDRHPRRTDDLKHVLDAGAGDRPVLRYGPDCHVTGIDIEKTEIVKNDRLDRRFVGDLQSDREFPFTLVETTITEATGDAYVAYSWRFMWGRYDLVVCWDTLEHVSKPEVVLADLTAALREDGLLVVKVPNLLSLKGLVTKLTPFWFHRWVYRRLQYHGDPFRTYLRWGMSPPALRKFAHQHGLAVLAEGWDECPAQQRIRRRFHLPAVLAKSEYLIVMGRQ